MFACAQNTLADWLAGTARGTKPSRWTGAVHRICSCTEHILYIAGASDALHVRSGGAVAYNSKMSIICVVHACVLCATHRRGQTPREDAERGCHQKTDKPILILLQKRAGARSKRGGNDACSENVQNAYKCTTRHYSRCIRLGSDALRRLGCSSSIISTCRYCMS